jgi:transposase
MEQISMTGCDLHDKNLVLRTAIGRGREEGARFPNTPAGRMALISKLKKQAAENGCSRILFAYEASGQGYLLHDELFEAGIECYVLAPTKIKRSEQDKRNKTDVKDSRRLLELLRAHCLAGNELPKVMVPSPQQRDDRELLRCRLDLASEQQRNKNKITALLKRNKAVRPSGERRPAWLKKLAGKSSQLEAGARAVLESLMRRETALKRELKILDAQVANLSQTQRHRKAVQELTKLKGVGLLSAMVFVVEMGNPRRFNNRRQVGAYAGLAPTANESGESNDRKGHITRQGSSPLRRVLCQCVWARIRTDPEEREKYAALVERNPKKKKIGVVALMRKLAIKMWHAAVRAA